MRNGEEEIKKVYVRESREIFSLKNIEYHDGMMTGYDSLEVFSMISPKGKVFHLDSDQKLVRIDEEKILICTVDKNQECKKEVLLDQDLNVLIPAEFDHIIDWDGERVVVQPNRREEIYSLYQLGENPGLLLEGKERIELYDHGWLRVYENDKWQFLDASFEPRAIDYPAINKLTEKYVAIPLRYIRRLREQNTLSFDPEKYARINPQLTFPLEVNEAQNLRDKYGRNQLPERVIVRTPYQNAGPRTLLMDLYGKVLSVLDYNTISYYEEGLITVYGHDTIDGVQKSVMGLLDMDGNLQIPLIYDKIESVGPDHIVVQLYGLYGVVSRENEPILPIKYGYVRYTSGYFLIQRFGKWGVMGRGGKEIVAPEYDEIRMQEGDIGFEGKRGKETVLLDLEGNVVGER